MPRQCQGRQCSHRGDAGPKREVSAGVRRAGRAVTDTWHSWMLARHCLTNLVPTSVHLFLGVMWTPDSVSVFLAWTSPDSCSQARTRSIWRSDSILLSLLGWQIWGLLPLLIQTSQDDHHHLVLIPLYSWCTLVPFWWLPHIQARCSVSVRSWGTVEPELWFLGVYLQVFYCSRVCKVTKVTKYSSIFFCCFLFLLVPF